jgi:hypothetical protein
MGTFRSGGVKQPIYYPLEQWSQTNMVVAPCDFPNNIHRKLAKIMAMMHPIGHSHMEGDMVHNSHMVFPCLTIPTF